MVLGEAADATNCYRSNRRNNMHVMSADVFGRLDAQVQGLPLYMLIMRHLLERKAKRHLFDKRLKPDVPRKCMVNMQRVWPVLVRLLYMDVIEDGSSTECDCCEGAVWPDTWPGMGCDMVVSKTCKCCFGPWNPPDLRSVPMGTKLCIPCIASVLVEHTYYVREPFSRKSAVTEEDGGRNTETEGSNETEGSATTEDDSSTYKHDGRRKHDG